MKRDKVYRMLMIGLIILFIVVSFMGVCVGRYSMNPLDVIRSVADRITGAEPRDPNMDIIFFNIRVPRVLAAILIGSALSISGAVYQSVFKNPLVSPDILGVSNGACVGAALAIILGAGILFQQVLAFVGGIIAVLLAIAIPRLMKNDSNLMLVLSGTIVSAFMCSILGIIKFVADEDTELSAIIYWQMGSLSGIKMREVASIFPVIFLCGLAMVLLSWRLNILSLGETEAKSLGVNLKLLRGLCIAGASMMTAASVCLSGTISWLGLIIPHLGRLLVGSDNTKLIPATILLGSVFMLIIDTIARTLTSLEIPLSILTGLIGAPIYAWLLYKQKAQVTQ